VNHCGVALPAASGFFEIQTLSSTAAYPKNETPMETTESASVKRTGTTGRSARKNVGGSALRSAHFIGIHSILFSMSEADSRPTVFFSRVRKSGCFRSLVTAALSVAPMGVSFWGMQQLKAFGHLEES